MSDLLMKYAGNKVSEVPPQELRYIITDLVRDANFMMDAGLDTEKMGILTGWFYKFIEERFSFMPINHLRSAVEHGCLGERGGTSKLIPRNMAIWMNEQRGIMQEQFARSLKQEDEKKRNDEMNYKRPDGFVATAVRMKVHWHCDGRITGEQYNSFSSKAIFDLLKAGVPERDIHPRDVVPNYETHEER